MRKISVLLLLAGLLLVIVVFYVIASELATAPPAEIPAVIDTGTPESIQQDCLQCEYLPEGAQRTACLHQYNCE